jgi:hypothetical protein
LFAQVDCYRSLLGKLGERRNRGAIHQRGKDTVANAVAGEDFAETARDDTADAVVGDRPYRVFAARTAAEVVSGDQDRRVRIRLAIQHEFGDRFAGGAEAAIVKQIAAETLFLH